MQATNERGNPQVKPALMVIVGSILAVVGTVMDWWTLSGPVFPSDRTEAGTNYTAGIGVLFVAIVMVVLGIIMWLRGNGGGGRGLAIGILIAALFGFFAAAYSAFAPEDAIKQFEAEDVSEDLGISKTQAELELENAFATGQMEAKAELGTYLATAGTGLALIGSIIGIVVGGRRRDPAPVGGYTQTTATPAQPTGTTLPGSTGTTYPPGTTPPPGGTAPPPGTPPGGPNPPSA